MDQIIPNFGSVKRSDKLMVATLCGAIYIAYYEVYRSADGDLTTTWSLVWESDYCEIDSDGVEVFDVYAWGELPVPSTVS